jgi:hypothetical protein
VNLGQFIAYLDHALLREDLPRDTPSQISGFLKTAKAFDCPPLIQALDGLASDIEGHRVIKAATDRLREIVHKRGLEWIEPNIAPVELLRTRTNRPRHLAILISSVPIRQVLVAILSAAHDLVPSYAKRLSLRDLADKREDESYLVVADDMHCTMLLKMGACPGLIALVGTGPGPEPAPALAVLLPGADDDLRRLLDFTADPA